MTWTVYILRCGDGSLYTGIAIDVGKRIAAHRVGKGARYTRSRLPVRDRSAALQRELRIKTVTRVGKLALIRSSRRPKCTTDVAF